MKKVVTVVIAHRLLTMSRRRKIGLLSRGYKTAAPITHGQRDAQPEAGGFQCIHFRLQFWLWPARLSLDTKGS
jgi:hypothetical protein